MGSKLGAQVFVSRLSSFTTKGELTKMFSKFGQVKEEAKRVWLCYFGSEDEARKAIRGLNGRIVAGRLIFVEHANTLLPNPDHID